MYGREKCIYIYTQKHMYCDSVTHLYGHITTKDDCQLPQKDQIKFKFVQKKEKKKYMDICEPHCAFPGFQGPSYLGSA